MNTNIKTYEIHATFKFPAWDVKDGIRFEVDAKTHAEALKRGRGHMSDLGYTRQDGPITYRAKVTEAKAPKVPEPEYAW